MACRNTSLMSYSQLEQEGLTIIVLEQRGRACWGRKDIRFTHGKSIVVFHCSACVLQDFLQSAGTPKIPQAILLPYTIDCTATIYIWRLRGRPLKQGMLDFVSQLWNQIFAPFCLFVCSTWRACGRLLLNGEKSRCRDWPWTEYANLVLFLWMCSSHEVLNVAGDEGDFSWGVQVSSERLWALSLLCCIPLHPTHHTVEATTRDCLEVGALTL